MFSFIQSGTRQIINNHISVQAAFEYSGYSLQYLRRLLRRGKLRGIKIGQIWLIEKDALDNYIEKARKLTDQRFGSSKMVN